MVRKRFAQHWLKSDKILQKIVAAGNLKKTDRVLEIGPGLGVLTRQLLSLAGAVVSVEIDRDLCVTLVKSLGKAENFVLLQGDFLNLDLDVNLVNFPNFQQPNKVVANIPYNITGPILEKLLGKIATPMIPAYESIVLLVQKEVGNRLYAKPGTKNFGALSVRVQYLAECELICDVPAHAFEPPPQVDSAVVRLYPRPFSLTAQEPKHLEQIVKVGFANKRKMLRNNLKSLIELDKLTAIMQELSLNLELRAEDLSVKDWVNLSDRINQL